MSRWGSDDHLRISCVFSGGLNRLMILGRQDVIGNSR